MIVDAAGSSLAGRREGNEDAFLVNDQIGLYLVADGVGGHAAGEVASELACQIVNQRVSGGGDLLSAIHDAHQSILIASGDSERAGMGTTLVALQLTGHYYRVAWVGDSRAYRYSDGITRLTRDHSRVQDLLDAGLLSVEQAQHHPEKGLLTQALGMPFQPLLIESRQGQIDPGQTFVLCTDGLTDVMSDADLQSRLVTPGTAAKIASQLVETALASDSQDNCTALVVRVLDQAGRDGHTVLREAHAVGPDSGSAAGFGTRWLLLSIAASGAIMLAALAAYWFD
jgi:PPM family protein phosphatase